MRASRSGRRIMRERAVVLFVQFALGLLAALVILPAARAQQPSSGGLQVQLDQCTNDGSDGSGTPGCTSDTQRVDQNRGSTSRPSHSAPPHRSETHDYSLRTGRGDVKSEDGKKPASVKLESSFTDRPPPPPRHEHRNPHTGGATAPDPSGPAPVSTVGGSPFAGFGANLDLVSGDQALAQFAVPPFLLPIYAAAGRAYGVPWNLLAAINQIETDFGRIQRQVSSAGALGWMQFMPGTWERYGVDASGDGVADPFNPVDAIYAAARYLAASGAPGDLRRAVLAYNHADWYADRVLSTAGVYGSLPSGIVAESGSLAFGRFPVRGPVRYGDDFRRAQANRGRPRGLTLNASGAATAVATQNVTVSSILLDPDLAGALRRRGALPERGITRAAARPAAAKTISAPVPHLPSPGPQASAASPSLLLGVALVDQTARGALEAQPPPARPVDPQPPAAKTERKVDGLPRGYGRTPTSGVTVEVTDSLGNRYRYGGLARLRQDVRPGAKLSGGRPIGTLPPGRHASMLFAVRSAAGEPVDPRPLVDGYRLQEATQFYHAVRPLGGNPFVPDQSSPAAVVSGTASQLGARVLRDPGIQIYPGGRQDIERGLIDKRVLGALLYLRRSGMELTVSCLRSGHSFYTASGNVSAHSYGAAVDIAAFNGQPVLGNQGPGSLTEQAIKLLMRLQGAARPAQLISLMTLGGPSFALPDHANHLHVGYTFSQSLGVARSGAALGPVTFGGGGANVFGHERASKGDVRRLSRRLSGIRNPTVPRGRGKGSVRANGETEYERATADALANRNRVPLRTVPTAAGAQLVDVDVPARAGAGEAYAIGVVDGSARRGWARRQDVVLRLRAGAWRLVGPPTDAAGRPAPLRLRSVAVARGGNGYAVGDGGAVVRLRGDRAPRVLRSGTRARLNGVDVAGGGRGYAVGSHGTVLALSGDRVQRAAGGSRSTSFSAVAFQRGSSAVAVGTTGGRRAAVLRLGGGGPVSTGFGLPRGEGVRLAAVAARAGALWVGGAVTDPETVGGSAELPFAARLEGGRWTTFCAARPALAAVRELGTPTDAGCDNALSPDPSDRGAVSDIAFTRYGVVTATAAGLLIFDSHTFRPLPAAPRPIPAVARSSSAPALALAFDGEGWALGADGRMTRLLAAAGRAKAAALEAETLPPGGGSGRLVAVSPVGDQAFSLGDGGAAYYNDVTWRAVPGTGVNVRDAAWAGASAPWAILDTGELVLHHNGRWTSPSESSSERRARGFLARALGGRALLAGDSAPEAGLTALAFRSAREGYAVGAGGTIMGFDGRGWLTERRPAGADLTGVAAGPGGVVAVGARGTLLERGRRGWSERPQPSALVRGADFTSASTLADGTVLATTAGAAIVRRPHAATWEPAALAPLGMPVARLAGYRTRGGELRALALVGPADDRVLLDGDRYGWRPVPLPEGVQAQDFGLDAAGKQVFIVGSRGRTAVALRRTLGRGGAAAADPFGGLFGLRLSGGRTP
jgi:hypothetical protein